MKNLKQLIWMTLTAACVACGTADPEPLARQAPDAYSAAAGSHTGQTFRHVLIWELNHWVAGLTEAIDSSVIAANADGDIVSRLGFWWNFDSDSDGDASLKLSTEPAALQRTWNDISSGKNLKGKFAGNDSKTDHRVWSAAFAGWSDTAIAAHGGGVSSPGDLLEAFFQMLEESAIARAQGNGWTGPDGEALPVHVTPEGWDLQQLINKTLLMGITFSQATDDYLDDDVADKGLNSSMELAEGKSYTVLEHAWDEAFGYFGAANDYHKYTPEEVAAKGGRPDWQGVHDTDGDGQIDLTSEAIFGAAGNASKRDLGAKEPTDYSGDVFNAFVLGRNILTDAGGAPSAEQMSALKVQRDIIVAGWEKAIAATVVHYINDVLKDMGAFGTDDYAFEHHAKVFSEMKGFALGLQYNPRSPMLAEFAKLHALLGDRPTLATASEAAIGTYKEDLLAARGLLKSAYGFADANMGDSAGAGGW